MDYLKPKFYKTEKVAKMILKQFLNDDSNNLISSEDIKKSITSEGSGNDITYIHLKTRYEMSKARKQGNKYYYQWLKDNKICTSCKAVYAENNRIKCGACYYVDMVYKKERRANNDRRRKKNI